MYKQSNEHRLERDFSELVKEFEMAATKLEMVIVVLPFKGGHVYDIVKKLGDLKYKIHTQCCIKTASMDPQPSQYEVEIRAQDSGQNVKVIQDMKNVVNKLLKQFNKIRDGVKASSPSSWQGS